MADGEDDIAQEARLEGALIMELSYASWEVLFESFDADAVVIEMDLVLENITVPMHCSVHEFVWPNPRGSYSVKVCQPGAQAFSDRLVAAGNAKLQISDEPPEIPGVGLIEGDSDPLAVGSLSKGPCPTCGYEDLVVESLRLQMLLVERYAENSDLKYSFRRCSSHGGHCYLGKHKAIVIRCCACLDTFVGSPFIDNALYRMVEEEQ